MTVAVPLLPEEVAVIVAEPAATPDTTPLEFTVAVEAALVDQLTVWPVMGFPSASLTVADSVVVAPTPIDADGGETVTLVTTGLGGGAAVTVIVAVPDTSPAAAAIVAEPAATPETTPLELTAAVPALVVDHATLWSLITFPWASLTTA